MAPRDNLQLRFSGRGWGGGERPVQPGSREASWAWPPGNLVSLPPWEWAHPGQETRDFHCTFLRAPEERGCRPPVLRHSVYVGSTNNTRKTVTQISQGEQERLTPLVIGEGSSVQPAPTEERRPSVNRPPQTQQQQSCTGPKDKTPRVDSSQQHPSCALVTGRDKKEASSMAFGDPLLPDSPRSWARTGTTPTPTPGYSRSLQTGPP